MPTTTKSTTPTAPRLTSEPTDTTDHYVLPMVHTAVPARVVNVGFWGTLIGSVALGAIDPPLGLLLGAGVLVARHHPNHRHP